MISICCCSINSKYETETFVRCLHRHNNPSNFEVILVHDDRVDDGSADHFEDLQREFSNLKVIRQTHEDTVNYLRWLIDYYVQNNILSGFRSKLRENIEKFAAKELFNHSETYLWLSSGRFYNIAVEASSGEALVITPADFIYLFSLKDAEEYIRSCGQFAYSSLHATHVEISNQDPIWLRQHINDVHTGSYTSKYRWNSDKLNRNYSRSSELYLPDFRNDRITSLDANDFPYWAQVYADQAVADPANTCTSIGFHGFHIMTRDTFNHIGGFPEDFYGRAYADNKMTFAGDTLSGPRTLPGRFSVAWCHQAETPMKKAYLHDGIITNNEVSLLVSQQLSLLGKLTRYPYG